MVINEPHDLKLPFDCWSSLSASFALKWSTQKAAKNERKFKYFRSFECCVTFGARMRYSLSMPCDSSSPLCARNYFNWLTFHRSTVKNNSIDLKTELCDLYIEIVTALCYRVAAGSMLEKHTSWVKKRKIISYAHIWHELCTR